MSQIPGFAFRANRGSWDIRIMTSGSWSEQIRRKDHIEDGAMTTQIEWRLLQLAVVAVLTCAASSLASAKEGYPSRPIKMVVPVTAGGAPDVVARIVADNLAAKLRQPVIVENRPGAGERLGAEYVSKAEPDGYTILVAPPGTLVISRFLYSRLPFQPEAFVPVTILTTGHLVLVARPNLPMKSLQELIEFAKANPGKLTYASPGVGTPPHLTGEMLKAAAHIQTTHVPYKGLAPAVTDLLAGHVDFMFDNLGNSLAHIRDGRLKVFGLASDTRISELPHVPTIAETYPGVRTMSWFGVVAPPKTPPEIAGELARAIGETLKRPEVTARLHALSFTPLGNSPAAMAAFLKQESERWRSVITAAGIKPE
jgi:tripartite-type tricarboxylate transporter receptor subunit TctC